MSSTEKLVYTVRELPALLGINLQSAYDLCHTQGFPAIRVSARRIVIPVDALNRWLDQQAAKGLHDYSSDSGR